MTHCDAFPYFCGNTRARIRVIRKTRHDASHASLGMCNPAADETRDARAFGLSVALTGTALLSRSKVIIRSSKKGRKDISGRIAGEGA